MRNAECLSDGSKVFPMSIPEGWEKKKLTELAEYFNGFAFKPEDWGKEGLPIIRIEQLKDHESISDYYQGRITQKNIIDNGDLVFSWSASLFLRIWTHGKAALNQHLFKVVEKQDVDRVFLKQFIEHHLPEITKASHGSTMQHITRKELDRFAAFFPTAKTEQIKIAEVLATVDRAIEQTEALIAKHQHIKTGLMQDLLTRGIDKYGNLRSEETHEFKDSPLGRIPVEWDVSKIGKVLEEPPKNGYSPMESDSWHGCYMLGLGCLTSNGFVPAQLKYAPGQNRLVQAATLFPGDFLISRSNTRERVGMVGIFRDIGEPSIYPDLMVRLRFTDDVAGEYMEKAFMSPMLRRQIENVATGTSGSMVKINASIIENMQFRKPSLDEQNRIVEMLHAKAGSDQEIGGNLAKLRSLKTALMQDLLTGKKRVTPLLEPQEATAQKP